MFDVALQGNLIAGPDRQRGEVGHHRLGNRDEIDCLMKFGRLVVSFESKKLLGRVGQACDVLEHSSAFHALRHSVDAGLHDGDRRPELMGSIDQEALAFSKFALKSLECTIERDDKGSDFPRNPLDGQARIRSVWLDLRGFLRDIAYPCKFASDDLRNGKKIAGSVIAINDT